MSKKPTGYKGRLMSVLTKLILCIIPLLMTPVWGYLIADGHLDFGGGEKDLLLLIPWMIWLFFIW